MEVFQLTICVPSVTSNILPLRNLDHHISIWAPPSLILIKPSETLPTNSVKTNASIAPKKLDAEHKAMDPRSDAGCLPTVMKIHILNPPQTGQRRPTCMFYISGKSLEVFPKSREKLARKFFYFNGVLGFFIWRNGKSKMMLTLLVKRWYGLVCFTTEE